MQVNFYNIQQHHLSYYQMHDQHVTGYILQFQDFFIKCCFRIKTYLWYTNYIDIMEWNNGLLTFQWQIKNNWFELHLGPGFSSMSPHSRMSPNIEMFLEKMQIPTKLIKKNID